VTNPKPSNHPKFDKVVSLISTERKQQLGRPKSELLNTNISWFKVVPLIGIISNNVLGIHLIANYILGITFYEHVSQGSSFNQAYLGFFLFIAGIIVIANREQSIAILKHNKILLVFLLYAGLSCFWSPLPFYSFKRWIQFLGIILAVLAALSTLQSTIRIRIILLWITALSISISLIFIFLFPAYPFIREGLWTGIFTAKNAFGTGCVFGLSLWLPALKDNNSFTLKILATLIIVFSTILMVGSGSATALVLSFLISIIFLSLSLPVPNSVKFLIVPIPFLLFLFFSLNFISETPLEFVLKALGRNQTLTGRTELWTEMVLSIKEHPFFGIGYNAFWTGIGGLGTLIAFDLQWDPGSAHNGYLDIINELGFIGFGIFLGILIQAVKRTIDLYIADKKIGLPFLLVLIMLILRNITASSFCRQSDLEWVLLLLILIAANHLKELQVRTSKQ